jgi:hypothetical protein
MMFRPLGLLLFAASAFGFASSPAQAAAASASGNASTPAPSAAGETVPLNWLGQNPPALETGVSFGVPWPRGAMTKEQHFALHTAAGKALPVQTWPLAYWPDGTLKWVGVATVAGPEASGEFKLSPIPAGADRPVVPAVAPAEIKIQRSDTTFEIDTGAVKFRIPKHGSRFIDSVVVDGREVAREGRLVGVLQNGPDGDAQDTPPRELLGMRVDQVTLEQSGPVRAVVKIEGMHLGAKSQRAWLPFVVRLYFYAGQRNVKLVHTFFFDGDDNRDFIRGLGLSFDVPMREEVQNRHVRFSGENDGLWAEPIQPMVGRGGRFVADPHPSPEALRAAAAEAEKSGYGPVPPERRGVDLYPRQLAGERVPNRAEVSARGQGLLADWAVWDDFKLVQPNADGFSILKRTNPASVWLPAGAGRRASGLVFIGDVSGGLGLSVKNFWQSHPASLEVRHAGSGEAELTAWLWSPDAPAMDLRHYDTHAHGLEAVYEDVQPGFSTAHGVARTSELMLFPEGAVPSKQVTVKQARFGAAPPVIVATPKYLHDAEAFGHWGLEDRSTPMKAAIEDRLARTLNFYLTQPEQQRWYGFWDFGDVMHSYDDDRHAWRYDLGGMAWANSELGPDLWLWYSFLRTGRADVFRMAEAMTRHTGEVDCYHLGPFAGLGSRHNVRHWGCGAKEARISQAAYRRFYYYLTTDERVGDVMREMLNADYKTIDYDPMRLAQPITDAERKIAPTRVRLGPDWFAFLGNWMTEWERTGDTKWRDKILAGVESLDAMPLGLRNGKNLVFGYDPATGRLYPLNDQAGIYNLATIMGGAEVVFELNMMLDDPRWHRLFLQYCRLYNAPKDVVLRDMKTGTEGGDAAYVRDGRLAAYVYHETRNDAFLKAGIEALARTARGERARTLQHVEGPEVLNPIDEGLGGTNGASQQGLETIAMLGLIGDRLPSEVPAATVKP